MFFFLINKFERFRNQIIQAVYSTPGIANPSSTTETTDEDILNAWKQIIEDRIKHVKQISDVKQSLKKTEESLNQIKEFKTKLEKVKEYLLVSLCESKSKWSLDIDAKIKESNIDTSNFDCKLCFCLLSFQFIFLVSD